LHYCIITASGTKKRKLDDAGDDGHIQTASIGLQCCLKTYQVSKGMSQHVGIKVLH